MKSNLHAAIRSGEIVPSYQPIVDMESGQPRGFEALARWESIIYGTVSPVEFIPFAEDCGLLDPLTESVFSQAAQAAAEWPEGLSLWLNIAPCQLSRRGGVERLFHLAEEADFDLQNLVLEITEGTCFLDEDNARRAADDLRVRGVRLAIDDFGVGYSNFMRLRALPFDILKLDSFVSVL
jgi:EAL domain-containing protein (putative c-di-GMP-specific phosphodiesterase class I)